MVLIASSNTEEGGSNSKIIFLFLKLLLITNYLSKIIGKMSEFRRKSITFIKKAHPQGQAYFYKDFYAYEL